jgi:hypothetical protein
MILSNIEEVRWLLYLWIESTNYLIIYKSPHLKQGNLNIEMLFGDQVQRYYTQS